MVVSTTRDLGPELRRGVVEHCVLALLRDHESYAFEIARVLEIGRASCRERVFRTV